MPAWGLLIAREHRWYLAFSVVLFFASFVIEKPRTPVISGDLVALFEPSEGPLGAFLGLSWGTVGAYEFDMLKKQDSSATAEQGGPAAVSQA